MSNRNKRFTRKEVIDILGISDELIYVLNHATPTGINSIFTYIGVIKLEIYRTLLDLGYDRDKLNEFTQANSDELSRGLFICKHVDDKETGYIRIDLVSIRQNLDKKIATWEMSKKPAEPEINAYEKACNEWLKGCGNSREMNPSDCYSCTAAFLEHVQKLSGRE